MQPDAVPHGERAIRLTHRASDSPDAPSERFARGDTGELRRDRWGGGAEVELSARGQGLNETTVLDAVILAVVIQPGRAGGRTTARVRVACRDQKRRAAGCPADVSRAADALERRGAARPAEGTKPAGGDEGLGSRVRATRPRPATRLRSGLPSESTRPGGPRSPRPAQPGSGIRLRGAGCGARSRRDGTRRLRDRGCRRAKGGTRGSRNSRAHSCHAPVFFARRASTVHSPEPVDVTDARTHAARDPISRSVARTLRSTGRAARASRRTPWEGNR